MDIDVIYLEPDVDQVGILKEGLVTLLEGVKLTPHVHTCTNEDAVIDACYRGQCDVFVCDLSLTRSVSDSYGGLAVIDRVKRDYPFVFVIGVTGGHPDLATVELHERSFDLFLQKTSIYHPDFAQPPNYIERVRQRYQPMPRMHVEIVGALRKPLGGDSPREPVIAMLVRQLFRSNLPAAEGVTPERIHLSPLGGGRSKSVVFRMTEVRPRGAQPRTIDSVVKISPLSDYREELERYNKYVKWTLPYDVRVDILGHAEAEGWGAIAYSFAHSGKKGAVRTLTDILQEADAGHCIGIIDKIYAATSALWLPLQQTPSSNRAIPKRYYDRLFGGETGRVATRRAALSAMQSAGLPAILDKEAFEVAGMKFMSIDRMLGEQDSVTGYMSMVHGDFNSNNIIVGEGNGIALIDFRDAGIGHLFEDIVALEGCARLHWQWDSFTDAAAHFKECLALERGLIDGSVAVDANSGWAVIQHIRTRAKARFPTIDLNSYYYALAYYCFRLLRLQGLARDRVPRLLAAVVAAGEEFLRTKVC